VSYLFVNGLTKDYTARRGFHKRSVSALKGISLTLHQGEIAVILGKNGAGKTTFMNILAGTLYPTGGTVQIEEKSPLEYRGAIGYLRESMYLPEFLSPHAFLKIMGELSGVERAALGERIDRFLKELSLDEERHERIGNLSMGNKRRLLIAHSFMNLPRLLLLDEPTVYLDLLGKERFYSLLLRMKEEGCTVIISSHLVSDVERLGERIIMLKEGMISHTFGRKELAAHSDSERFIIGLLKDEAN